MKTWMTISIKNWSQYRNCCRGGDRKLFKNQTTLKRGIEQEKNHYQKQIGEARIMIEVKQQMNTEAQEVVQENGVSQNVKKLYWRKE